MESLTSDSITPAMPRKPKARPLGRPVQGREAKVRFAVMLEPRVAEKLRKLGNDNLSAGIAKAAGKVRP